VLLFIIGIAVSLGFWNFDNRWVLNQDQGRDAIIALYALRNGKIPEIGSPSSAGPFNFGPWYHWIIMFWEKVIPTVGGPWIGFGIMSIIAVIFYYLTGGWIAGLIAAVAIGLVENSPDMLNTVIVGFSSAIAWWATKRTVDTDKWKWGILVGIGVGLSINFHFQSWGLMAIPLAIVLINKYHLKKRIKWGLSMLTGWIMTFLPIIIFDIQRKGIWIKSVIEYYTVGVNKFYVPVRWLTELRDFWPQLFGSVIIGWNNFGYIWVVLGMVAIFLVMKNKIKINRFWWIVGMVFIIQVLLMRNYKGVRSREYFIAFYGILILICSWIMTQWFKFNKYIGAIIFGIVLVLATMNDWKNINEHQSQTKVIKEIKNELDLKISGPIVIEHYLESDMASMPLFYLYYQVNGIGNDGTRVSICDGNKYKCPGEEVINRNNYKIYLNKNFKWYRLTPENIYERLMVNYKK